jgi:uncharacterized protein (TIGR01244 family)
MRPTIFLTACLSATALLAQVPEAVDPGQIPNYKMIAPGLVAAGQPAPEALAKLSSMGFKTVLSLRMPGEGGTANEREVVEGQGLRYVSVPMTAATFSLADLQAVEKVLGDPAAGPILFHCTSANRVGGVWAAVQARRGASLDAALAKGREAGLRSSAMEEAVKRVLEAPTDR